MDNKAVGVKTKLMNICVIPNPHADPLFEFHNKNHDSLRVPFSEIILGEIIGTGQFGKVYKARFRGNLDVAAKQLKVKDPNEGKRVLEEFFAEIATMRELNHPNLIQLFAYVINEKEGNFMIQELMEQGDMKNWLQRLKKNPVQMRRETKLWSKLLSWCIEVADAV
jgi:serine/threonine protein kinase